MANNKSNCSNFLIRKDSISIKYTSVIGNIMKQAFLACIIQMGFLLQSCGQTSSTTENISGRDSIAVETTEPEEKKYPIFQDFLVDILFYKTYHDDSTYYFEHIQFPFLVNGQAISRNEWKPFYKFSQREYYSLLYSDTAGIYDIPDPIGVSEIFVFNYDENKVLKFEFKPVKDSWSMTSIVTDYPGAIPDSEFMEFFLKFSKDSIFQKEHVRYPFQDCEYYPEVEPNITLIHSKDWMYRNLSTEEVFYSAHLINQDSKFRILQARGIGCGIALFYFFEKISGKWYLIKSEDYST